MDAASELQEIYDSGMIFSLQLCSDGWFRVTVGKYLTAVESEVRVPSLEEAITWLKRETMKRSPGVGTHSLE
jgi:hypothetical protein